MKMPEYRNAIRQDFIDTDNDALIYEDKAIDRAVISAIEDITRLVPFHKSAEIRSNNDSVTVTYTKDASASVEVVDLGYPVRLGTLVVTSPGPVTYVQNDDYIIDHLNGTVTFPTGSDIIALANTTVVTFTFEKSRIAFTLSPYSDLRSLEDVEVYSGSQLLPNNFNVSIQGNVLHFNEYEVPTNYYIIINYLAKYTNPDDDNDGNFPDTLSELVIKGAEANLLFAKAISIELGQSAYSSGLSFTTELASILTDLASGRTNLTTAIARLTSSLAQVDAVVAAVATDATAVGTALTAAVTQLTTMATQAAAGVSAVDTEVVAFFTTAASVLAGIAADLTAIAGKITDSTTALTAGATMGNTGITFIDTEVGTDLTDAKADIETTAQSYLDLGDDLINEVNEGEAPDRMYAQYAETETKMAGGVASIAKLRLELAADYLSGMDNFTKQGEVLVKQAEVIFGQIDAKIKQAQVSVEEAQVQLKLGDFYNNNATIYLEAAKVRISEANQRIGLIGARAAFLKAYLDEAGGYFTAVQGYQKIVELTIASISARIAAATEARAGGGFLMEVAERLRIEASRRYNDFQNLISHRSQTNRSRVTMGTQPKSN